MQLLRIENMRIQAAIGKTRATSSLACSSCLSPSVQWLSSLITGQNGGDGREGRVSGLIGSAMIAYLVAIAATALAVLLRWSLDPIMGDHLPLVTLFGAIAVTVWFGGYRPALLAAAMGYVACAYLFVEPRGSLGLGEVRNLVGFLAYIATCGIIIGFGQAMRESRRRFEELVRQHVPSS